MKIPAKATITSTIIGIAVLFGTLTWINREQLQTQYHLMRLRQLQPDLPIGCMIGPDTQATIDKADQHRQSLVKIGDSAFSAVITIVQNAHEDEDFRESSFWLLGEFRPVRPEAIQVYIDLLDHPELYFDASDQLEEMGEKAAPYLRVALQDSKGEAKEQILKLLSYFDEEDYSEDLIGEYSHVSSGDSE